MAEALQNPGFASPRTPLIGREADLSSAAERLLDARTHLLTFTGPPGAGKTRLALALAASVAEAFPDGVFSVDLSPVSDPAMVATAIAQDIGLRETGRTDPVELLEDLFSGRKALLLLDNFEQVYEAGPVLSKLLLACGSLKVLVTSRVPLHVVLEDVYEVRPLALPERASMASPASLRLVPAVDLFVQRAEAARDGERLTDDDVIAAAEVAVRLDGLPLALELAAARCRLLSPRTLLERLERRLELLTGGPRDLPARHQTLRAAIGWSYGILMPEEQAVFRGLAIFSAGCDVEAAEAVLTSDDRAGNSVLDAVQAMVTSNLVLTVSAPGGRIRLRMLETIREYAQECLDAADERRALAHRHAEYYLALAEQGEQGITSGNQAEWLDRLEADHANLLSALRSCIDAGEADQAVRLASVLWRFWWRRGHLTEGRLRTAEVLAMPAVQETTSLRASALLSAGLLALWQADYETARQLLGDSLEAARRAGDQRTFAYALVFQGRVSRDLGEPDAASLGAEGVEILRELGDRWGLGVGLHFLGLSLVQYDIELARGYFQESAEAFAALGVPGDMAMPLRGLGLLAYLDGNLEAAQRYFEESASLFRSVSDEWSSAMVWHDLGSVAETQGSVSEASAFLLESLKTWRKLGNKRGSLICLAGLVRVAYRIGADELAVQLTAAIQAIVEDAHIVLEPTDGNALDDGLAQARRRMNEDVFTAAREKGRSLEFDAAISLGQSVEEHVRTLGPRRPTATARRDVLSPREREVAALLPLGMTNRQIADALVITEGTANLHVKHILAKLGFTSRAQIAAWVVANSPDAGGAAPRT